MSTLELDRASSLPIMPIDDLTAVDLDANSLPRDLPDLGKPRAKRHLDKSSILAVVGSLSCLAITCFTVLPHFSIPWKLGVTRQFQILGFLLSLMNQCFLTVASTFFLLVEARFGHSYLQNYDAILRNSFTLPSTNYAWRGTLMTVILMPISLGLVYKEFDSGIAESRITNNTGSFYGLTAPAGLQESGAGSQGLSFMANGTLSFYSATYKDPIIPSFPQAYGFNTLLLSNESSAKLDAPFPDYVELIQENLRVGETYVLTAPVLGTVTSYNDSIESHRDDDNFWSYYLNQIGGDNPSDSQDEKIGSGLYMQDIFGSGRYMTIFMNNLNLRNTSWIFAGFVPVENLTTQSDAGAGFKKTSMLFQTQRKQCNGTWRITYNSVQLLNGSCDQPPLSDRSQVLFTNATFAIPEWYVPSFVEYLAPFTASRQQSVWLIPTFTTIVNGVFWSRALALNYVGGCGPNKSIPIDSNPNDILTTDLCYHIDDYVLSARPAMNTSPWLFIALSVQPALTIAFLFASLSMYSTPLDRGFGMIALLAGVRTKTLKLLQGASFSGELNQRLRVKIAVQDCITEKGHTIPRNEYILGDDSPNGSLSHGWRQHKPWSYLFGSATLSKHPNSIDLKQNPWKGKSSLQYRRLEK